MPGLLASATDVAVKFRPLSTAETAQVNVLIGEASALLRRAVNGLDTLMASGAVDATLVTMVVTNAVMRVMRNPSGVNQQSAGPEAAAWSGIRATGEVTITPDDVAKIVPVPVAATAGGDVLGTVRLRNRWLHPQILVGEGDPGMLADGSPYPSPYAEVPPTGWPGF